MWVAYGILALNGGDEIIDERALLLGTLPHLPLGGPVGPEYIGNQLKHNTCYFKDYTYMSKDN